MTVTASETLLQGGKEGERALVVPNWQSHLLDRAIGEMKCACASVLKDLELR